MTNEFIFSFARRFPSQSQVDVFFLNGRGTEKERYEQRGRRKSDDARIDFTMTYCRTTGISTAEAPCEFCESRSKEAS